MSDEKRLPLSGRVAGATLPPEPSGDLPFDIVGFLAPAT